MFSNLITTKLCLLIKIKSCFFSNFKTKIKKQQTWIDVAARSFSNWPSSDNVSSCFTWFKLPVSSCYKIMNEMKSLHFKYEIQLNLRTSCIILSRSRRIKWPRNCAWILVAAEFGSNWWECGFVDNCSPKFVLSSPVRLNCPCSKYYTID